MTGEQGKLDSTPLESASGLLACWLPTGTTRHLGHVVRSSEQPTLRPKAATSTY